MDVRKERRDWELLRILPEFNEIWRDSFDSFLKDVGRSKKRGWVLILVNKNKGWIKGNVIWADKFKQKLNKRNNEEVEIDGVKKLLVEFAEDYKISCTTLWKRLNKKQIPSEFASQEIIYSI
jgi:hypothetical protein